ncbi:MAG: peptide-methionine (R)-S-oxide reductase MsrB [Bacteroidetes bacterium]|nr:peptide-methionine (R)-S-oxide reductase MsrB [Bacteroidota bacterium]MDA0879605.1 peptide-methionine (R)-S-oxide reductase MsrB [Bacteroidota bacterium]MDA1115680.1 peptide-methionine (R)-S-oxide reductase MsrB [Bacteroidota bacterium]
MKKSILLCSILVFVNCQGQTKKTEKEQFPVQKTESEWKSELSEMEYYVLRKAGTERAFSSEFNNNHKDGMYVCAACGTPLFKSENKFDSGSGWPSFDREIKGNVAFSVDYNLGYARTEEHCANCGGHLGHVFNDGPSKTTGKRHCINGVALDFIPNN